MRLTAMVLVLASVFITGIEAHACEAPPYGPAPESMTWRLPPDYLKRVAPDGQIRLPRSVTEMDVWVGSWRLRQLRRHYGACFARNGRCLALYNRSKRRIISVYNTPLRVYGWWS